jgi:hypothetical protein
MKYPELKVNIPEPCHEDWNQMTATGKGKFCGVCTKEVIDFTAESDETIVKHFQKNMNVCGRFHASQLDRKLIVDRKKRNHWLSYAASLLFPMALFSQEVKKGNQNIPRTEQTDDKDFKSMNIGSLQKRGKVVASIQKDSISVSGIITDDTRLSLPGATILIKGTQIGKSTDFDGNYSIKVKKDDVLVFSYVGFETQEVKVNENRKIYNVLMKASENLEICNVVAGGIYTESMSYGRSWHVTEKMKETRKRVDNYFAFQKKKWKENLERKRAERTKRKAEKAAKRTSENN